MSNSRFSDVINAARTREQEPQESLATSMPPGRQPAPPPAVPPKKRGRPAGGKRNDPEYEQVAAYIPKEVYKRVRMRLLEMDKPREFSDLVEFLLRKWLQSSSEPR